MEQEMVDSVVQEVYNNLYTAWLYNKKAKVRNNKSFCFYYDKYKIILDCIKKIENNNIKEIKYRVEDVEDDPSLIIVRFKFLKNDFNKNSFSFHLPKIYKKIIKNLKMMLI